MKQEDDVRERDEDDLLGERVLEGVDGPVDQFAAVVEGFDRHAGRQAGRDRGDPFLHALDDRVRVLAIPHDHNPAHHFTPVHIERTAAEVAADLHGRHVAQINGRAFALREHGLFEIADRADEPQSAHHELHAVFLDDLAADVKIALPDGLHDFLQRHARRAHFHRGNLDLILPHEATDARDFGHAGHGVELVAHEPILFGPQATEVVATRGRLRRVHVEVVLKDPPEPRSVRPELGCDILRKQIAEIVQPFEHPRAGEVVVDLLVENHRQQREAEHGIGAHRLHPGEALEVHGERIGDLVLDLLRAAARPVGEDDDLVFAEVRNGIHGRAAQLEKADGDDDEDAARDEEAVAQRPCDEPRDHG